MTELLDFVYPDLPEIVRQFFLCEERMVARMLRLWDFKAHGKPMVVRWNGPRQDIVGLGVLRSDILGLASDDGAKIPRIRVHIGEILDREDILPMSVNEFNEKMAA